MVLAQLLMLLVVNVGTGVGHGGGVYVGCSQAPWHLYVVNHVMNHHYLVQEGSGLTLRKLGWRWE
jgi:hypothetical protein